MNKKVVVSIIVMALVVFVLTSCVPNTNGQGSSQNVQTSSSGNWSYIPLNLQGSVEENFPQIGDATSQWEENNNNLEIVSFQIIYQEYPSFGAGVKGVLIYSLPR